MPATPLISLADIQETLEVLLCFEAPQGVNYEIVTRAVGRDFEVRVKLWATDDDVYTWRIAEPPGPKTLNGLFYAAEIILDAAWDAPAVSGCEGAKVVKSLDVTRMGRDQ